MINIKKTTYFFIKSSLALIVFLTLVLFFYAAFFFEPPLVKKIEEDQITESEKSSSFLIEKIESEKKIEEVETEKKIEEVETEKKIVKSDGVKNKPIIIKDNLFATVGNKAVTHSDIVNEIKMILILSAQRFSEDKKIPLQNAAVKQVIKKNIKQIEIEKFDNLEFNRSDLEKELGRLAAKIGMNLDTLKNTFAANEVDFSNLIDQIKTELLWNSLIFELYKDRLTINVDEINEELKLIQNKKEIEQYLISEIIIEPVPKEQIESKIKEIKNKIKTEGFKKVALELSIAKSAINGGDLGWLNENVIAEKIRTQISSTPIGNISEPILLPEGILILKVRDKKKIKNILNLEDAKNQLVDAEKSKILNLHSLSHYDNLMRSISVNYY